MPIRIVRYSEGDVLAVKDFNERLRAGGAPPDYVFSESPIPAWLPYTPGSPVYNEFYLALEDDAVRGTFVLKHQKFSFSGEIRPAVYLHHPFSEGIVNKKYAQVGAQILKHAVRSYPMLFALGMGGYDRPLPRMLQALHWKHCLIPFYFRVNHPARFLRNTQALRQDAKWRLIADAAAFTGSGWVGLKAVQTLRGWRGLHGKADWTLVEQFDDWTDEIWKTCAADFTMIGVRDRSTLRMLYPGENRKFLRLKVTADGRPVGWVVAADSSNQGHPQYGDLRVGLILDGLARPEFAQHVIAAATRALIERGVDLITCNQSHRAWVQALRSCGFFKGPSNFIFAASKGLSEILEPFEPNVSLAHLNRGDGDNLLQYQ